MCKDPLCPIGHLPRRGGENEDPLCPLGISPVEGERMKTLSALKGISPVEGETMRGGNGKRSGNGKRRSLDDDKYDDNNIKTSGPTSRMVLPLYGGDAQGAERVFYV